MEYNGCIDVSLKLSSLCVLDVAGKGHPGCLERMEQ